MSAHHSEPTPDDLFAVAGQSDPDRILVVGGSARTLDFLRLASIRSDEVVLIGQHLDEATRAYAGRFAMEWIDRAATAADLVGCASVLVATDDLECENRLVRAARRSGVPIHVSGRPLVSDFSLLEFLEHRPVGDRTSVR